MSCLKDLPYCNYKTNTFQPPFSHSLPHSTKVSASHVSGGSLGTEDAISEQNKAPSESM